MYYTIYKITNILNRKFYIGKHITNNINDNYYGSGPAIINAIKKYGKENFIKEILYILDSKEEMDLKESELITENLLKDINCYNMKLGGNGGSYKGINLGTFWITNGIENKKLKKDDPIPDGWYKGLFKEIKTSNPGGLKSKGKIWVTNGIENTMVLPDFIPDGWYKGRNNKFKEDNSKFINGGKSHLNTIWITNGIENKKLKKDDPIPDGWYRGKTNKK